MMIAFCLAVAAALLSVYGCKVAFDIPSAAGAGAAGSIVLVGSGVMGIVSILLFGITIGLAIAQQS